jgi:integrase
MPEKKIADRIRDAIRLRGYSIRTEKTYVRWYERYVLFHKVRHPSTMGAVEVEQFLTHLVSEEQISAATQNQALHALLFLYREVIGIPLGDIHTLRAKKSTYVQPYLSHDEFLRILGQLSGVPYLIAAILYGGGLRLLEALRLRVKDLDFEHMTLTVHDAKSNRDRVTFLPDDELFLKPLRDHLVRVRRRYDAEPDTPVSMPPALARKYRGPTNAGSGSTSSLRVTCPLTRAPTPSCVIICTPVAFRRLLPPPSAPPQLRNAPPPIPSVPLSPTG